MVLENIAYHLGLILHQGNTSVSRRQILTHSLAAGSKVKVNQACESAPEELRINSTRDSGLFRGLRCPHQNI